MQVTAIRREFGPASFVDVLRHRADVQGTAHALTFLADGDGGSSEGVSYEGLDLAARAVAAGLQGRVARGDRVLLLFPHGLDWVKAFFGCLYAGAIAVPAPLPRPNRPSPRLIAVVGDASPSLLLTTAGL